MTRGLRVLVVLAMLLGQLSWGPLSVARAAAHEAGVAAAAADGDLLAFADVLRSDPAPPGKSGPYGAAPFVVYRAPAAAGLPAMRPVPERRTVTFRRKCPQHRARSDASDLPS